MTSEEAIKQLNELKDDRMSFVTGDDNDHDEEFLKDIKAIEYAIDKLKADDNSEIKAAKCFMIAARDSSHVDVETTNACLIWRRDVGLTAPKAGHLMA